MWEQLLKHLGIILFKIESMEFSPDTDRRKKTKTPSDFFNKKKILLMETV